MLSETINKKASDLHLIVGYEPFLRVYGNLIPVAGQPVLTPEETEKLIFSLVSAEQKEMLLANSEIDFSISFGEVRFRVNAYYQEGSLAAALRLIPFKIPTIDELNLPKICHSFTNLEQGFILIVGPTGHGKSTTVASILQEISNATPRHIITIEDPIEYIFQKGKGLVSQRELQKDTHSWNMALRSALREDPDVVFIGEMRDQETISSALTIAETGHLVFSTLHTNSAAQTIDRIIDSFPKEEQSQARMQLSLVLEIIISQRLVPTLSGERTSATEILVATSAVKNVIREGKTHLIDNIIQTSAEMGMVTLEMSLINLVKAGKISLETAQQYALRPEELMRLYRTGGKQR